ncbi:MAG TPA: hypothetical protein VIT67_16735 [Povalibacter sp.]
MRNATQIASIHQALTAAREAIAASRQNLGKEKEAQEALSALLGLLGAVGNVHSEAWRTWWPSETDASDYLKAIAGSPETLEPRLERFDTIRNLLIAVTKETLALLAAGRNQQAYACIDATQALPTALLSARWDPHAYWSTYLEKYQSHWRSSLFEPFRPVFGTPVLDSMHQH